MFEICQMGKVVQYHENALIRVLQVIKHELQHLYQINRRDDSSALVISKK